MKISNDYKARYFKQREIFRGLLLLWGENKLMLTCYGEVGGRWEIEVHTISQNENISKLRNACTLLFKGGAMWDSFLDERFVSSLCNGSSVSRKNGCATFPVSQNESSFCNGSSSRGSRRRSILPIKPRIIPVMRSQSSANPATQHDWLTFFLWFWKVSQRDPKRAETQQPQARGRHYYHSIAWMVFISPYVK